MNKVVGVVLGVSATFAILACVSGATNKEFSFNTYVESVTENVKEMPVFPTLKPVEFTTGTNLDDVTLLENICGFFVFAWDICAYAVESLTTVFYNASVLVDGFINYGEYQELGGAGSGHGGGGFGSR